MLIEKDGAVHKGFIQITNKTRDITKVIHGLHQSGTYYVTVQRNEMMSKMSERKKIWIGES